MTSTTDQLIATHLSSTPRPAAEVAALLEDPGFGKVFTDHMVTIDWTEAAGWHDAKLVPYGPLPMDPASNVLHYAQEIFEGLKAYRTPEGAVVTFRPQMNAVRLNRSAHRLAMPELPTELFLASVEALVAADAAYVPADREKSLYLRPFMISTEIGLGVRPAASYKYVVIGSPAGAYFPQGVRPVTVWLSQEYVRAVPGGTGEAKCGGNYAASLRAQLEASAQGCDQVVWLDALEHRWVEEMGGMNLCFVYGTGESARIVTPELTGALLPGVTRDSLLRLANDLGYACREGRISTDAWEADARSGELTEVFACGTAAVITPVGTVKSATGSWTIGDGEPGPVTMRLRDALLDLQTGVSPDPYGWRHPVPLP